MRFLNLLEKNIWVIIHGYLKDIFEIIYERKPFKKVKTEN
jgi:hypothetical protein